MKNKAGVESTPVAIRLTNSETTNKQVGSFESGTPGPAAQELDLRNPVVAVVLAWLIPGAGHFYQGRRLKGWLYLICILGTYVTGLWMGGGHVVYASWTREDRRWQFALQAGVGLPVLPAIVQNRRVMANQPPLLAPVLAPPIQPVIPGDKDELAAWHYEYNWRYDVGTLYTIIAGLLNFMVMFDAASGPAVPPQSTPPDEEEA